MPGEFPYDVFLSHSAKDKLSKPPTLMHDTGGNAVVRDVAKRLRKNGLMPNAEGGRMKAEVPFHPSSLKLRPLASRSSGLVLCISANAFGSDWAQLESGTFQVQGHHAISDPLNKERRSLVQICDRVFARARILL
jgi:hypothetical protein